MISKKTKLILLLVCLIVEIIGFFWIKRVFAMEGFIQKFLKFNFRYFVISIILTILLVRFIRRDEYLDCIRSDNEYNKLGKKKVVHHEAKWTTEYHRGEEYHVRHGEYDTIEDDRQDSALQMILLALFFSPIYFPFMFFMKLNDLRYE